MIISHYVHRQVKCLANGQSTVIFSLLTHKKVSCIMSAVEGLKLTVTQT